jgi:hypothetical protein
MYILCNEEPLWMIKCLSIGGPLEYKGSWKKTALCRYVQIQVLQTFGYVLLIYAKPLYRVNFSV